MKIWGYVIQVGPDLLDLKVKVYADKAEWESAPEEDGTFPDGEVVLSFEDDI